MRTERIAAATSLGFLSANDNTRGNTERDNTEDQVNPNSMTVKQMDRDNTDSKNTRDQVNLTSMSLDHTERSSMERSPRDQD